MLSLQILNEILGGGIPDDESHPSLFDYHELILEGFSYEIVAHAIKALSIPDIYLGPLLGMSTDSLAEYKKRKARLDPIASDRLFRLARVAAIAAYVLEDLESALSWLGRPQVGLMGKVPLDLIITDPGARLIEDMLGRIEHSVLS